MGFQLQVIVTLLVAVAVVWAGFQTGDWSGILLVVPLALLIPVTARLPSERPRRGPRGENAADRPRY